MALLLSLIFSIIVVLPLECSGCAADVTLVEKNGSAFLRAEPMCEHCEAFRYILQSCEDESKSKKKIVRIKQEEIHLCPRWTGCTEVTIQGCPFFGKYEEEHGHPKLTKDDIHVNFDGKTQRLYVTVRAYEPMISVSLDLCAESCPEGLLPVSGNRSNKNWIFNLDGKGFVNDSEYIIEGSFRDKCDESFPIRNMTFKAVFPPPKPAEEVHDLYDMKDEIKIADPSLWLYERLDLNNISWKIVVLTSEQAKATEVRIKGSAPSGKQQISHSDETHTLSSVDTERLKNLASEDQYTDCMEETMEVEVDREKPLNGSMEGLFEDALHFIIRRHIGLDVFKCFQVRMADRNPDHDLQFVTPSRVFKWPAHLPDLLEAIGQ